MYTGPLDWAEAGWTVKLTISMKSKKTEKRLSILEFYPIPDFEISPSFGMDLQYVFGWLF